MSTSYCLVYLRNGACSIRSLAEAETFHPVIGPAIEAEALYVRQLRLPERVRATPGEFVVWDVGLGAAANALTAIRLIRQTLNGKPAQLRLISFDHTSAAAAFALEHSNELGYPAGFETPLTELIARRQTCFSSAGLTVDWSLELGDFPALMSNCDGGGDGRFPKSEIGNRKSEMTPHAILFDPYSPKKNPAMWAVPLFAGLFCRLDPQRSCTLATYTRSTLARVAMLLGGFFVGVGHPSGLKEETTVAANRVDLLDEPLDRRWLERAKRSHSAEPLNGPAYRPAPLSPETRERLQQHPQFR